MKLSVDFGRNVEASDLIEAIGKAAQEVGGRCETVDYERSIAEKSDGSASRLLSAEVEIAIPFDGYRTVWFQSKEIRFGFLACDASGEKTGACRRILVDGGRVRVQRKLTLQGWLAGAIPVLVPAFSFVPENPLLRSCMGLPEGTRIKVEEACVSYFERVQKLLKSSVLCES